MNAKTDKKFVLGAVISPSLGPVLLLKFLEHDNGEFTFHDLDLYSHVPGLKASISDSLGKKRFGGSDCFHPKDNYVANVVRIKRQHGENELCGRVYDHAFDTFTINVQDDKKSLDIEVFDANQIIILNVEQPGLQGMARVEANLPVFTEQMQAYCAFSEMNHRVIEVIKGMGEHHEKFIRDVYDANFFDRNAINCRIHVEKNFVRLSAEGMTKSTPASQVRRQLAKIISGNLQHGEKRNKLQRRLITLENEKATLMAQIQRMS